MESKSIQSLVPELASRELTTYKNRGAVSVVKQRSYQRFLPTTRTFQLGDEASWDINTGSGWIQPQNSVLNLKIDIDYDAATTALFLGKDQSITNIISKIEITNKGESYENVSNVNLLSSIVQLNTKSSDYLYYGGGTVALFDSSTDGTALSDATTYYASIPLSAISGFFGGKTAIPSLIGDGMNIKITFATGSQSFVGTDGSASATITPEIFLDIQSLVGEANKFYRKISASKEGISYQYKRYTHKSNTMAGTDTLDSTISTGLTNAVDCLTCVRLQANVNDEEKNSLLAEDIGDIKYQYKLANNYFPSRPIQTPSMAYNMSLKTFGKLQDTKNPGDVSYSKFTTGGRGLFAVDLNRSSVYGSSGMNLRSGAVLDLSLELPGNVDTLRVDSFTGYVANIVGRVDGSVKVFK
jgi:hypothetical protein